MMQLNENSLIENSANIERMEIAEDNQKTTQKRDRWSSPLEFLMSCLSLSVGLGNLWRFPYVCAKHGGSAFLIPYIIILFFIGKPFYFLEMILGQFTTKGSIKAMEILPIMKGIGFGQQISGSIISTYYTAIIGLTLTYLIRSFAPEIPWNTCDNLGTTGCKDSNTQISYSKESINMTSVSIYLDKIVLDKKSDISDGLGSLVWPLVGTLLISWLCVYISIVKGIRTSGKLAYVFAILPYMFLIFLLSYAVSTLDGAWNGIYQLIKPDWEAFKDPEIWFDACTQCFYSLTVGMGCIITFSGYNKFSHNIYRDATIISLMDTFTSILGTTTIFAILGNLHHSYNGTVDFKTVASSSDIALVFNTYPDAISKMSNNFGYYIPQIMSILFFFMLFVLGVGSSVGLLTNLITNIKDFYPNVKIWKFAGISCIVGFFLGLVYVTQGGINVIGAVDDFVMLLVFVLAIFEIIALIWFYGLQNICWDIEFMLGIKLSGYWRICWAIIIPVFMCIALVFTFVKFRLHDKKPLYLIVAGWIIFAIGFSQLFFCVAYLYAKKSDEIKMNFKKYLFTQNKKWGPKESDASESWRAFKEQKERERKRKILKDGDSWYQQKLNELLGRY